MRSHEEVVERLKAKNKDYIANRRKKIAGIAGIVSVVVLVGILIPIDQQFGKNTNMQKKAESVPTEGVSVTPTGDVKPVEKDPPTVTVTPTVSLEGRSKANVELTGEQVGFVNQSIPQSGTVYASRTLNQMIQENSGRDDILYSVILTIQLDWKDAEVTAFENDFRVNYEKNPLYEQYKTEYETWLYSEYMPYLSERVDNQQEKKEDWEVLMGKAPEVFPSVWQERHPEEWEDLQVILDHVNTYDNDIKEIRNRLIQEELSLIQKSGMLTYCYPAEVYAYGASLGALITAAQFENLLISDRFSYHFKWSESKDLGDLEKNIPGFTKAVPTDPVRPEHVIVIDSTDPRIDKRLQGEQDADEVVTITLLFGDTWGEGQRILREQYPKEYAAYMEMKESSELWDNDDPRLELALRGHELHNSLPGDWEEEQEAKFFERHPDFLSYRETYGVMCLYMRVPFSLIPEIAKDDMITEIRRAPEDKRKPEVIGEYQGVIVYDLQGIDENADWLGEDVGEAANQ